MSYQYKKFVDFARLAELASNYDPLDILDGKIRGKGTGALRNIENRLRVISITAPKYSFVILDKINDKVAEKKELDYWRKVMKQPGREVERCVAMAKIALQNELMPYPSSKEIKNENSKEKTSAEVNYRTEDNTKSETSGRKTEELVTQSSNRKNSLEGAINKITTFATAVAVTIGLVGGCIGYYLRDKSAKEEIAKLKAEKQIVYVVTDKHPFEKEYTKLEDLIDTAPSRIDKKLVERKAELKTEDKEVWGNAGYIYKKDIPEHKKYTLKERAKLQKRWANIDEKIRRDTKKLGNGLYDFVKLKHPVGGPLRAISGFGGVLNGVVRGFVRPIAYFFTRSDTIDKAIDDFMDASYFGDSYNVLHKNILGLDVKKTGSFIREHPIKSTISIAEDVLPFIHWKHGVGEGEEAVGTVGNPPIRGGGPETLIRLGGPEMP